MRTQFACETLLLRWERRFGKTKSSAAAIAIRTIRAVFSTRMFLQVAVCVAGAVIVIGIALWDSSIRRFLEGIEAAVLGVILSCVGYSQIGLLLAGGGVLLSGSYVYSWCRVELAETSYPHCQPEISRVELVRESVLS